MTTRTIESACGTLDQLRADHDELMPCAARLAGLAASDPGALRTKIAGCEPLADGLDTHVAREDEVFPVIARHTGDGDLAPRFRDEHREILAIRNALIAAAGDPAAAEEIVRDLAERLAARLTAHMAEENGSIFRRAASC